MSLNLEQVYSLPHNAVFKIIKKNNGKCLAEDSIENYKLNRLTATINIANNNKLDIVDKLYLNNKKFKNLYLSDDSYLLKLASIEDVYLDELDKSKRSFDLS